MKTIKIDEQHAEKLTAAIAAAEGKARARTITAADMVADVERISKRFALITKAALEGVQVDVDHHAQNFPKAYKYTPESTHFSAVYKRGAWYLVSVQRDYTRRLWHEVQATLTDKAREEIIAKFAEFTTWEV